MAEEFISSKDKKLSFKDIVLGHLKKILEMSTTEFRGGYNTTVMHGNWTEKVYVPSSKKNYIQAVEHLSYVLLPHFDNDMEKDFNDYEKQVGEIKDKIIKERKDRIVDEYNFQVRKAKSHGNRNPPTKIELEEELRESVKIGGKEDQMISNRHLILAKTLFQNLNLLLKRREYLKTAIFSESDLERDEEDEIVDTDKKDE